MSEEQTVESFGLIVNLYSPAELTELAVGGGSPARVVQAHVASFVQRHAASFRYGWWVVPQTGFRVEAALYWSGRHWLRVHLESLTCAACGASFHGANPYVQDLYAGQREWAQVQRDIAAEYPSLPCAQCGAKLRREAIWLERRAPPRE